MTGQYKPCCKTMAAQLNWSCSKRASPSECPDALVGHFADGPLRALRPQQDESSHSAYSVLATNSPT